MRIISLWRRIVNGWLLCEYFMLPQCLIYLVVGVSLLMIEVEVFMPELNFSIFCFDLP